AAREDGEAVAGGGEKREVDARPSEPGGKPAQLETARLQDGEAAADHRHVALVEVAEGRRRGAAGDAALDDARGMAALLERDLGDAGQRAAGVLEERRVAHHEDLRPPGHAQIGLYPHATAAIGLRIEPLP